MNKLNQGLTKEDTFMRAVKFYAHAGEILPIKERAFLKQLGFTNLDKKGELTKARNYTKRFLDYTPFRDTIYIVKIYEKPLPAKKRKKNSAITRGPKTTYESVKGYKNDMDMYEKIVQHITPMKEYKGLAEISELLDLPELTSQCLKQHRFKDLERFIKIIKVTQRKWIVEEIYEQPLNPDKKKSRFSYSDTAANIILKGLYEDMPSIKEKGKMVTHTGIVQGKKQVVSDLMTSRNDLSRSLGFNSEQLNVKVYERIGENYIIINQFVKQFDSILKSRGVDHKQGDVQYWTEQMSSRLRSMMNSALNKLENKCVIIRYEYTDLFYDIDRDVYGPVMGNMEIEMMVNYFKKKIMHRYKINNWEQISRMSETKKMNIIKEFNQLIKNERNIRVFRGYWIRIDVDMLEECYLSSGLKDKTYEQLTRELNKEIKERQQASAAELESLSKQIGLVGDSTFSAYSDNYVAVSSELYSSVFQPDKKYTGFGHIFLQTISDMFPEEF